MASSKELSLSEYKKFIPHHRILFFLSEYQRNNKLENHQINILDWGCGNGKTVLWFLERGYNAFGVDVEDEIFLNAAAIFESKGFDVEEYLAVLNKNKTTFPDNRFDYVISYQVFEHVEDMDSLAKEISRITKLNGIGYHKYPPRYKIVEGHLFMPLIHWLPKNKIRFFLIWFYVLFGIEPKWNFEDKHITKRQKAIFYYNYSIKYTHYRTPKQIIKIFDSIKFCYSLESISNPKVFIKINVLCPLLKIKLGRNLIAILINNFYDNELLIKKIKE